jgi:hypothetical protein
MAAIPYHLEARPLTAADAPWAQRFAVGEEWWAHEITDYLRDQALDDAEPGLSSTTLFSFPELKDIVGFCTAASGGVPTDQVTSVITVSSGFPAARVPAVLIPYFATGRQYRGVGHFGQEMHLQLLEALAGAPWAAVRLLYVECWEENSGGLAFWEKLGYLRLQRVVRPHPGTGVGEYLWRLVYDRFALQQP